MYVDSVRGFKERCYVIKPMTDAARKSLYHMVEETENGVTVSRRRPRFPLAWSDEQFKKSTDSYLIKDEKLSEEEKVGLEALKAFVARFRPGPCVTREGSPVLDEEGKPTFGARHINTKGVLKAPNSAARKELLGNRILLFLLAFTLCLFCDFATSFVLCIDLVVFLFQITWPTLPKNS
jgi:hypothetical protein